MDYSFLAALSFTCIFFSWQINSAAAAKWLIWCLVVTNSSMSVHSLTWRRFIAADMPPGDWSMYYGSLINHV